MSKQRAFGHQITPVHQTHYKNLLVSGCSYTWNNSEEYAVTWPYYLRDLAQFETVYDCSQVGSGCNHTFNSIIYEIETNKDISADNTFIIVMWPHTERVDMVADINLVKSWSIMQTQQFDNDLSTLSLYKGGSNWKNLLGTEPNKEIESIRQQYYMSIGTQGQVFESYIKLIALHNYLENLNFKFLFLHWDSTFYRMRLDDSAVQNRYDQLITDLTTLGQYATDSDGRVPNNGHPTPDAHLAWTRQILYPYLIENNLI